MKTDTVFKRAYNQMLDLHAGLAGGTPVASENELSRRVGVSRTTIRKVLAAMTDAGLVEAGLVEAGPVQAGLVQEGLTEAALNGTGSAGDGTARAGTPAEGHRNDVLETTEPVGRRLGRAVQPGDRFPDAETQPRTEYVEQQFMEWMLRGDTRPGTQFSELDLARQFNVATTGIREFLIRFSRFGLIEKRANSGWLFKGITEAFALDLFEIRMMFELRSAHAFAALPPSSPLWGRMDGILRAHHDLIDHIDTRFHDFSALDNRFHRLINEARQNRFIDDFYDIITFIFHYHYQWNKRDEAQRNAVALAEHVAYIDALISRDAAAIDAACRLHLASARQTLIGSLIGVDAPLSDRTR